MMQVASRKILFVPDVPPGEPAQVRKFLRYVVL
jgi:hypothetical protein